MKNLQTAISEILGTEGRWFSGEEIASIPTSKGAYVLLVQLGENLDINLPAKVNGKILPGWYVYCGSAHNRGGIRGRLKHHFQKTKRQHWHIDCLTINAVNISALSVVGGNECELVGNFLEHSDFDIVINGFGSSDCSNCKSHLLAVMK